MLSVRRKARCPSVASRTVQKTRAIRNASTCRRSATFPKKSRSSTATRSSSGPTSVVWSTRSSGGRHRFRSSRPHPANPPSDIRRRHVTRRIALRKFQRGSARRHWLKPRQQLVGDEPRPLRVRMLVVLEKNVSASVLATAHSIPSSRYCELIACTDVVQRLSAAAVAVAVAVAANSFRVQNRVQTNP